MLMPKWSQQRIPMRAELSYRLDLRAILVHRIGHPRTHAVFTVTADAILATGYLARHP